MLKISPVMSMLLGWQIAFNDLADIIDTVTNIGRLSSMLLVWNIAFDGLAEIINTATYISINICGLVSTLPVCNIALNDLAEATCISIGIGGLAAICGSLWSIVLKIYGALGRFSGHYRRRRCGSGCGYHYVDMGRL